MRLHTKLVEQPECVVCAGGLSILNVSACPIVSGGNASVTYTNNIANIFVPDNECATLACNFSTQVLIRGTEKFTERQNFYCKDGLWTNDPEDYFCIATSHAFPKSKTLTFITSILLLFQHVQSWKE